METSTISENESDNSPVLKSKLRNCARDGLSESAVKLVEANAELPGIPTTLLPLVSVTRFCENVTKQSVILKHRLSIKNIPCISESRRLNRSSVLF